MSHNHTSHPLPAPCIIDVGVIINNEDMRRVLNDLVRVHYIHTFDNALQSEGRDGLLKFLAILSRALLLLIALSILMSKASTIYNYVVRLLRKLTLI